MTTTFGAPRGSSVRGLEDGDLLGARRTQVLLQQGQALGVEVPALGLEDVAAVRQRLGLRVDATDLQLRQ
jgi:hypothetical protein